MSPSSRLQLLSAAPKCPKKKFAIAGLIKAIFFIKYLLNQFMTNPRLPTEPGDVIRRPRTATKLYDMKQDRGKASRFFLKPFHIKWTKILSDDWITGYKSCIFNSSLPVDTWFISWSSQQCAAKGVGGAAVTCRDLRLTSLFSSCFLTVNVHTDKYTQLSTFFMIFIFFCKIIFLPMNLTVYIQWKVRTAVASV